MKTTVAIKRTKVGNKSVSRVAITRTIGNASRTNRVTIVTKRKSHNQTLWFMIAVPVTFVGLAALFLAMMLLVNAIVG